ncbi:hypothetical protein P43SY_009250 [Pythium insidiosum]|uniref:Uncharacterized protein n=1 Tax=Pythium insidiosum TaxID=114742 RepID=A0AAD5Q801_PYTIN|nr:hypothetical protein P43SY_009250 [Pythium insidiosum]
MTPDDETRPRDDDDSGSLRAPEVQKLATQEQEQEPPPPSARAVADPDVMSAANVVMQHIELFQRGVNLSSHPEQLVSLTDRQSQFLEQHIAEDVRVDLMHGRDALIEQGRRFSALFADLWVSLQRLERIEVVGDGVKFQASTQMHLTLVDSSIALVFPRVQLEETLKSKLLGVRISCPMTLIMTGIEHEEIRRELLRALPHRSDGSWQPKDVSAALRALHASLEARLAAQEAEYDAVDAQLRRDLDDGSCRGELLATMETLDGVRHDADALLREVEHAETHFGDVSALLAPATARLRQLSARAAYLETALEVERRSAEAKTHAEAATMDALASVQAFAAFVQTIPESFAVLRREARRRVAALSQGVKRFALVKLQEALAAVDWPRSCTALELDARKDAVDDVARAFGYLVALQLSQDDDDGGSGGSASLWAMDCVLEPVRLRFRFHFERADSPTNRLTKPEWFLAYIVEQTQAHSAFLDRALAPALRDATSSSSSSPNAAVVVCADPVVLFLRGLIRTAAHKLTRDLPALLTERAVLCHTIDEVLLFEQAVDDSFGYAAFADGEASPRRRFPRLVDALTADADALFAWTTSDLQFARETLHAVLLDPASQPWAPVAARGPRVPAIAGQFTALLDLLCRRLAAMADDGHRYLYVTQVLVELLRSFQRVLVERRRALPPGASALADRFALVNTAQHVADVLSSWDQHALFLELLRRVVASERSRHEVLRMHLAFSRRVLKTAAKAATETILAREEAVAVRQAIAGPGSVIGPAAAFTAAYSVGSKTVKSLFGQARDDRTPAAASDEDALPQRDGSSEQAGEVEAAPAPELEEETLLLARSVFERPIAEFKGLAASLLAEIQHDVERTVDAALTAYRSSPQWDRAALPLAPSGESRDVSCELAAAWTALRDVLLAAKTSLSSDALSQFWKPLAAAVDDAVAPTVLALGRRHLAEEASTRGSHSTFSLAGAATAIGALPASPRGRSASSSSTSSPSSSASSSRAAWTAHAKQQLVWDLHALLQIVQLCAANPRAYLRKTADVCRLAETPRARLTELDRALEGVERSDSEQITTLLEACGLLSLRAADARAVVRLFVDAF